MTPWHRRLHMLATKRIVKKTDANGPLRIDPHSPPQSTIRQTMLEKKEGSTCVKLYTESTNRFFFSFCYSMDMVKPFCYFVNKQDPYSPFCLYSVQSLIPTLCFTLSIKECLVVSLTLSSVQSVFSNCIYIKFISVQSVALFSSNPALFLILPLFL